MTHSTKTPVSEELRSAFKTACEEKEVRYIKVTIEDDTLKMAGKGNISGRVAQDFDEMAKEHVKDAEPCFFLFRLDTSGQRWLFVSYVPDAAPVKQKMVYASANATLKRELGDKMFPNEMSASEPSEMTYSNYQSGSSGGKPQELPWSREELVRRDAHDAEETARQEQIGGIGDKLAKSGIGGFHVVQYPFSSEAEDAIKELSSGSVNWVKLSVDPQGSKVNLEESKTLSGPDVSSSVDPVMPAFYFYKDSTDAVFYIYSCPDKSPAKFRMVYSTCKPSVLASAEKLGLSVRHKMEVRGPDDVTPDALREAKQPKKHDWSGSRPGSRPTSNPASRGGSTRGDAPPAFSVNPFANDPNMSNGSNRKKIVIPPSGAYC